jgi:hypothetical protein
MGPASETLHRSGSNNPHSITSSDKQRWRDDDSNVASCLDVDREGCWLSERHSGWIGSPQYLSNQTCRLLKRLNKSTHRLLPLSRHGQENPVVA